MSTLNSIILSLATAYAALGVLLLVGCLFTRLPWPVKAGAIAVTASSQAGRGDASLHGLERCPGDGWLALLGGG